MKLIFLLVYGLPSSLAKTKVVDVFRLAASIILSASPVRRYSLSSPVFALSTLSTEDIPIVIEGIWSGFLYEVNMRDMGKVC